MTIDACAAGKDVYVEKPLTHDLSEGKSVIEAVRKHDRVVQVWWVPRQMMTAKFPSDGSEFISHYEYRVGGRMFEIPVRDVIHVRFGLDPKNPRMGLSPLGSLAREVGIDDYASNFTAAILRNLGIIGIVISPKTVGNHVEHIYSKIGASTRAAASLFAIQRGLLPEEPPPKMGATPHDRRLAHT